MAETEYLAQILERKRKEVARRQRHTRLRPPCLPLTAAEERAAFAIAALRRTASQPNVIAEIKRRSPSAGEIRKRERGDVAKIAQAYVAGGAAAVSVLCDGPGFGGSALDLRRASRAVGAPLLFKEFVLDELQLDLARAAGAHMVLLIVRALSPARLQALVNATRERGMAPVVEAADADELMTALATGATIVGVNARDLRTFRVDKAAAQRAIASIPVDRIAVHMSGVHSASDLAEVAAGRADAVLVGESLMRAPDPTVKLRELLSG